MRKAFILSFVANVLLALASWRMLPDRVAVHFGRGGVADNWASSGANLLITLGMDAVLFVSLFFSPRLAVILPAKWVNLPNRQYWLAPENRVRAKAKLAASLYRFGVAIFLFLLVVELLALQANLSDPVRLNEAFLFCALGILMVYSIAWCIFFYRSFRVPEVKDA
jgi:hypothetical protein